MMTRAGRRGQGPVRWIVSVLLVLAVAIIYAPQLLAFPYQQRIGTVTVYAERPIDSRIGSELAHAEGLLRASPIYTGPLDRSLFLTDGGWRWRLLAIQSPGAFAFRRPFSSAIVFNRSDVGKDRVMNGRAIGGTRTLSGVIAHETTHVMIANHLGEVRSAMLPTWQQEGYADHVARESSLTDAEAARLRKTDPGAPGLVYYDARQRVATALSAKRGSVDAFFAGG